MREHKDLISFSFIMTLSFVTQTVLNFSVVSRGVFVFIYIAVYLTILVLRGQFKRNEEKNYNCEKQKKIFENLIYTVNIGFLMSTLATAVVYYFHWVNSLEEAEIVEILTILIVYTIYFVFVIKLFTECLIEVKDGVLKIKMFMGSDEAVLKRTEASFALSKLGVKIFEGSKLVIVFPQTPRLLKALEEFEIPGF